MKSSLLSAFVALFIAGCSARGPVYQDAPPPAASQALVYFYRTPNPALSGRDAYMYVDGKNVIDLQSNGYFFTYVSAGVHAIKQAWPIDLMARSTELTLDAKAGHTYYFALRSATQTGPSGLVFVWGFYSVSPNEGREELKTMRLQQ